MHFEFLYDAFFAPFDHVAETTGSVQVVDMSSVPVDTQCTFSMTVRNFMGIESVVEAEAIVERVGSRQPLLHIQSDRPSPWYPHMVRFAVD